MLGCLRLVRTFASPRKREEIGGGDIALGVGKAERLGEGGRQEGDPNQRPVLLGGNQDDEVNYAIEQRPVYSYRVPADYSPPPADFQLPVLEGAHQKKSDR